MSRIYFHSQGRTAAEVRGSERAFMGVLCSDLMLGVLGNLSYAEEWLKPLLGPDHYLQQETGQRFAQFAATWFRVGMGGKLHLPGGDIDPWTVSLNTALAIGGDEIKLFARLHGQCEVHCWVEGTSDKHWLADIIEIGREREIMRRNQGWESVIELLREPGDFPIVCSYSVCEQFPNFGCLPEGHPLKQGTDEDREDRHEAFYELDRDEAWSACMEGLRASGGGLRITQDDWDDFHFGQEVTAFNLQVLARSPAHNST